MKFGSLSLVSCVAFMCGNSAFAAEMKKITVGEITFQWSIVGKEIEAKVSAKTNAWVGIGFLPTEGMKDANIVIGSVKDTQFKIENDFGTHRTKHEKNTSQGCPDLVKDGKVTFTNGITEIHFKLPLDASTKCHKPIATDKDIDLILASGKTYSFLTGHPNKYTIKVNLSTGAFKEKK